MIVVIQPKTFCHSKSSLLLTEVFSILMSCLQFHGFLNDNKAYVVDALKRFDSRTCMK